MLKKWKQTKTAMLTCNHSPIFKYGRTVVDTPMGPEYVFVEQCLPNGQGHFLLDKLFVTKADFPSENGWCFTSSMFHL